MIVSHRFAEARQQCRQGVIPFRLLQEQVAVLIGVCENPHAGVADSIDITEADIEWLATQPESKEDYEGLLGGAFHLCQSSDDLLVIEGFDAQWIKTHDGCSPNVTDLPMSWDSCRYVSERDENPNWVQFLLCSNNAGGPVYYVPRELWRLALVEEHMMATDQFWS